MSVQICEPGLRIRPKALAALAGHVLEEFPRIKGEGAEVDLFGKNPQPRPAGAVFVLAHDVHYIVDSFEQLVFFNRTETQDELWVYTDACFDYCLAQALKDYPVSECIELIELMSETASRAFAVPRQGSFDEALAELTVSWLWHEGGNYHSVRHLIATGYISQAQWRAINKRLAVAKERERLRQAAFAEEARANETEIIRVARELGLNPEPAGTGPVQWWARCPQTSHRLMITTTNEQFGCGYCRRKGGVEELREFVAARKTKYDYS